jgi:RNA polymerase sigma-70 factor (ECF subfamily)
MGRVLAAGDPDYEPERSDREYKNAAGGRRRSNSEWIIALNGGGDEQATALTDLRTYLLRAALFTLQRSMHSVGHLRSSILSELAEDCAQEALTSILQRLGSFRGESRFTTWAYAFAVNTALVAARRERWVSVSLDRILEGTESLPWSVGVESGLPDPERHALQAEVLAAIRDGIEQNLTLKQQQVLRALVFEGVPLDEVVRHWGSNRNAVYKMVHDARRKLKSHLMARGFDLKEILDAFAGSGAVSG